MNRDIMEDLEDAFKVAFEAANNVLEHAENKAAYTSKEDDVVVIATNLFIQYCNRTARETKADPTKIGKPNNSDKMCSKEQIKLIKTLYMTMGAKGEKVMAEMRDAFGFEQYEELKMGQAHMVIDALKAEKEK